jgi:phosphate uptake regulator
MASAVPEELGQDLAMMARVVQTQLITALLSRPGQDPAFVLTHLFVSKFLERIGDSILNIGETTLFILSGERLKLHQYLHLEEMVRGRWPTASMRSATPRSRA